MANCDNPLELSYKVSSIQATERRIEIRTGEKYAGRARGRASHVEAYQLKLTLSRRVGPPRLHIFSYSCAENYPQCGDGKSATPLIATRRAAPIALVQFVHVQPHLDGWRINLKRGRDSEIESTSEMKDQAQ
ncbi:hypothetical protein B0H13DRAFT_1898448 [Mycena leptocephala]|nr:hypothetical protein B0H13DRAFT_1898448 [Mycena leptocephala]